MGPACQGGTEDSRSRSSSTPSSILHPPGSSAPPLERQGRAATHMIQPTMPAKLGSGSVSTTSNTPSGSSRRGPVYSGMKSVECTRQRCRQAEEGAAASEEWAAWGQGRRPRCTLQRRHQAAQQVAAAGGVRRTCASAARRYTCWSYRCTLWLISGSPLVNTRPTAKAWAAHETSAPTRHHSGKHAAAAWESCTRNSSVLLLEGEQGRRVLGQEEPAPTWRAVGWHHSDPRTRAHLGGLGRIGGELVLA